MPKQLKPSLKSIVAAASPGAGVQRTVVELKQPVRPAATRTATLKERAKQLSVYLEPEVYDQLRDIAYTERTKIHTLMLEGLDLLFRDRGAKSVRDLESQRNLE